MGVDPQHNTVWPPGLGPADIRQIPFDHLVLAVGGVTNKKLIPGSEHARTFKTLADAMSLRKLHYPGFGTCWMSRPIPPAKKPQLTFGSSPAAGWWAWNSQGELTVSSWKTGASGLSPCRG